MDLNGTAAIVSGGASGLGEATSRVLAAAGATVVIADLNEENGKRVASDIGGLFARTDVADETSVQAAVDVAAGAGVPLRTAVSCAGIGWAARTVGRDGTPHDLASYQKVIAVNLIGTFNLIRLAATAMMAGEPLPSGERGVIVNTASIAAYDGQIGQIAYAASKGGIVGLTLPAARDLAVAGIRVCTIAPGTFDTPLLGLLPEPAREALGQAVPFPSRLGRPEEYADLALQIVSNEMLNGEVIRLDGALRMPPR
jgi:NAD(P)-dependent dehydrogenase (short-subunit alcohol dehydrogenase family)